MARAARAADPVEERPAASSATGAENHHGLALSALPAEALDERIAIVGTAGSGKTYAAKGFVEGLLESGVRLAIVDPLGVWWGLRVNADGSGAGYPVIVFGGRHADVPIVAEMGSALGRLIAQQAFAAIVDLSELGSNAARRRFMAHFAEALYEENQEPLHLILDEADLWAPQRPIKGWEGLLGHIEEIVRRGRVRGFIPWLITQRPAVVHKDVLSQADILIAMKLTASQDRDAIGAWIEGQADRQEGKRILGELPRLPRGQGYLWAPAHGILDRVAFPRIRTFDSSRTPRRGEMTPVPQARAEIDLTAITEALNAMLHAGSDTPTGAPQTGEARRRQAALEQELVAAKARIATLEQQNRALTSRLTSIAALAAGLTPTFDILPPIKTRAPVELKTAQPVHRIVGAAKNTAGAGENSHDGLHPAGRKLLMAAAQHAPGRFTWGQLATLAGLKPTGGHFNAGRQSLRLASYIAETDNLVTVMTEGMKAAGEVPPTPSTPVERLNLWCGRLPSPAPEILRALAANGDRHIEADDLAALLGKKPTGGHWNSGIAVLRNNGLIEVDGRRYRISALFRD